MSFIAELKRRNVFRVGAAYVVAAWLIIQVVETIFPAFDFSDAAVRIVVIVLSIGLVPVVILAWAFELTPEGLKLDKDVSRGQSISARTGKKLDRIIMVVLALALGYFAIDKFVLDPTRDQAREQQVAQQARSAALVESYGEKSIAVLAFDDLSPAGNQQYFSDGIAEELLNLLAKIPELRVAGRTSAFSFKGKAATITEIGEKLNVAHVLEGSVRMAGDQIRITVQLIEARSDTHIWSETYDRTLDDIFAIQDEIAAEVVAALKMTLLGGVPQVEQINPEAYALYLQARHLLAQFREEHIPRAEAMIRRALTLDPDNIRLLQLLGWVNLQKAGNNDLSVDETCELGREEVIDQMSAIHPDHPLTLSYLARLARYCEGDLPKSARLVAQAYQLDPTNPDIVEVAGGMAGHLNRFDIAIELYEYTVRREPLCAFCVYFLGNNYMKAGRWDEAEAAYRTAASLGFQLDAGIVMVRLLKGDPEGALEFLETLPEGDEIGRAFVLHDLGRQVEFEALFNQLRETLGDVSPLPVAMLYAWTGANDAAFEWLARLDLTNPNVLPVVVGSPAFSKLYGDPRWTSLLEPVGRSPAQLAAIEFDLKVPK